MKELNIGMKVMYEGEAWDIIHVSTKDEGGAKVVLGRLATRETETGINVAPVTSVAMENEITEIAHEMTAKEYAEKLKAVFGNVEKTDSGEEFPCQGMNCADCPFYLERRRSAGYDGGCTGMMLYHPDLALKLMEEWFAGRNTKKKPRKTYLEDFREKMPNAIVHKNGRPGFCRRRLYNADGVHGCEYGIGCDECWNEEMPEVSDNAEG